MKHPLSLSLSPQSVRFNMTILYFGKIQAISKPAAWHKFGSPEVDDSEEGAGSYFISAVCWKSDSPTMLAANSRGTIKVMVLAA